MEKKSNPQLLHKNKKSNVNAHIFSSNKKIPTIKQPFLLQPASCLMNKNINNKIGIQNVLSKTEKHNFCQFLKPKRCIQCL